MLKNGEGTWSLPQAHFVTKQAPSLGVVDDVFDPRLLEWIQVHSQSRHLELRVFSPAGFDVEDGEFSLTLALFHQSVDELLRSWQEYEFLLLCEGKNRCGGLLIEPGIPILSRSILTEFGAGKCLTKTVNERNVIREIEFCPSGVFGDRQEPLWL